MEKDQRIGLFGIAVGSFRFALQFDSLGEFYFLRNGILRLFRFDADRGNRAF